MNILLVIYALGLNLSISMAQIAMGLLFLVWLGKAIANKQARTWRHSSLEWPLLIFSTWVIFGAMLRGSTTLRDLISNQSSLLLVIWAAQTMDKKSNELFLRWISIGAVVAALWGIMQVLSKINYLPSERVYMVPESLKALPEWLKHALAVNNERAMGPRNHPLTYAESFIPGFFLLLRSLMLALAERGRSVKKLVFSLLGLGLVSVGILLAQGRAVWLGIFCGVMLFGLLMGTKIFLRFMIMISVVLFVISVASPRIRGRLLSVASVSQGTIGDQDSKSMRYALWHGAIEGIKSHPVFGVGLGGARLKNIDPVSNEERTWTEAHNLYLQVALEHGVIGLGLFGWIVFILIQLIRRLSLPWRPAFAGILIAFLIAGLTESWSMDKEIAMFFWTLMGSLVFLSQHEKE